MWPSDAAVPGLRASAERYLQEVLAAGDRLAALLSLALGLPRDALAARMRQRWVNVLLNYYPACTREAGQFGVSAHYDVRALGRDPVPPQLRAGFAGVRNRAEPTQTSSLCAHTLV